MGLASICQCGKNAKWSIGAHQQQPAEAPAGPAGGRRGTYQAATSDKNMLQCVAMSSLLAVDLGLRTGLALFAQSGKLRWYRSSHFASRKILKKGAYPIIKEIEDLAWLVAEGDRQLFEIWNKPAQRRGVRSFVVAPERWRRVMLYSREQRCGEDAKRFADSRARRIIEWSGAPKPTSLKHDVAEAILIGMWGVVEVGWLEKLPPELVR